MDIHFVSTLTPEDEHHLACTLIAAVGKLLAQYSLAYALRIETSTGQVLEDSWASTRDGHSWRPVVPGQARHSSASGGQGSAESDPAA